MVKRDHKPTYVSTLNSAGVVKLIKAYKFHVIDALYQYREIMPIEKFYWLMRQRSEIPASKIFEDWIKQMHKQQNE